MIAKLSYALILIVHPDPTPRVYATFATAADCRAERAAVVKDIGTAQITTACVPQNQITMTDMTAHMQEMIRMMQDINSNTEKEAVR